MAESEHREAGRNLFRANSFGTASGNAVSPFYFTASRREPAEPMSVPPAEPVPPKAGQKSWSAGVAHFYRDKNGSVPALSVNVRTLADENNRNQQSVPVEQRTQSDEAPGKGRRRLKEDNGNGTNRRVSAERTEPPREKEGVSRSALEKSKKERNGKTPTSPAAAPFASSPAQPEKQLPKKQPFFKEEDLGAIMAHEPRGKAPEARTEGATIRDTLAESLREKAETAAPVRQSSGSARSELSERTPAAQISEGSAAKQQPTLSDLPEPGGKIFKPEILRPETQKPTAQESMNPEPAVPEKNPRKTGTRDQAKHRNDALLSALRSEDIRGDSPSRKKSRGGVLRVLLMAALLVVLAGSSVNLIVQLVRRAQADRYYTDLREQFYSDGGLVVENTGLAYLAKDVGNPTEARLYSDEGDIYQAPELSVLDMSTRYRRMLPNLEALKGINASAFGWIKVEGTRVDYPVVKSPSGNNDYYLYHGLDMTFSDSGSIFMDYHNSTNLSRNRNTCIYGHNMNDGTMFQTIMNFKTRNQFQNGQIQIYTADGVYLYTPFSVYDALPTESFFKVEFDGDEEFGAFLTEIKEKSMFYSNTTPGVTDKIVTLITCTNTLVDKRFVVHGVLTEIVT